MHEEGFLEHVREGITYYQAPLLDASGLVHHAFSSRRGGVSGGNYASLNLAYHVGDRPEHVEQNRRLFLSLWSLDSAPVAAMRQVHGTGIVGAAQALGPSSGSVEADALHTDRPGIVLTAAAADCLLLFFLDPVRRAIAIAHAGWRGTLDGIAAEVVRTLREIYGSSPRDLKVAISPAIGPCCFTVDRALWRVFSDAGYGAFGEADGGRCRIDLTAINRRQLLDCGLPAASLAISRLCTCCRNDIFFSHRAQQPAGRMLGFISIIP